MTALLFSLFAGNARAQHAAQATGNAKNVSSSGEVGKWLLAAGKIKGMNDPEKEKEISESMRKEGHTMEFRKDGVYIVGDGQGKEEKGKYVRQGNMLTVTIGKEKANIKILSCTATQMEIVGEDKEVADVIMVLEKM